MAAEAATTATATATRAPLGWRSEVGLFLAAYALYGMARWVVSGSRALAVEHTGWVVSLERDLGLFHELSVQQAIGGGVPGWVLAQVYLTSELLVLPLVLIWFYRRRPGIYVTVRDTILIAWVMAVPIFAAFPVAPPRLADLGFADTVSSGSLPLHSRVVTPFYNPYAAVPSLHAGFALAIGVAFAAAARGPLLRVVGLAWPLLVIVATIATGNHFVLDAVAGCALTVLAWGLATSRRLRAALARLGGAMGTSSDSRVAPTAARPRRAIPSKGATELPT